MLDQLVATERGFVVAAAGCGKTELLARATSAAIGRQLLLTHTHAGIAALTRRLVKNGVPRERYHVETIAGWCLRYARAYPSLSRLSPNATVWHDWTEVYPAAVRLLESGLGRRVVQESFAGVFVDEYQDCTEQQHEVVMRLARVIPCGAVGDPLQSIFGFAEPVVSWEQLSADFNVLPSGLKTPWRWSRDGHNQKLGNWLVKVRRQLQRQGNVEVVAAAPVRWVRTTRHTNWADVCATECRNLARAHPDDSIVAIVKWPANCMSLAKRLGGRWPVVERFDHADLPALATAVGTAEGRQVQAELVAFLAERMTGVGTDLKSIVRAIESGRGLSRIKKNRHHAERLLALADDPTPETMLSCLEGILEERGGWWLYRRECVYQLRDALMECSGGTLGDLADAVAVARTRARHRGRRPMRRSIGTPLLLKGLEFDHAVLVWEPWKSTKEELYVGLTRASMSLTVIARDRVLQPALQDQNK